MIRPLAIVSAGTLGSRLSGFVRDMLLAALFGAGLAADAFLLAFQLINVARRLLSEGALNAVLVPAYTRIRNTNGEAAAAAFAGRALGAIGLAVVAAALLFAFPVPQTIIVLAPGFANKPAFDLAIDTLRLMLPYLAFAGPVAVMAGVLNARGSVVLTSVSPMLFNAVMIAAVAVLMIVRMPAQQAALVLAALVGAAGCLQLFFLGATGTRHARPLAFAMDPELRRLFGRALPAMIAQSAMQLALAVGALFAVASPSAVSFLYFASRLVDLPLGLIGTATGAVLIPRLSEANKDEVLPSAMQLTLGLALPAAVGLALLAHPIVAVLFERGAFSASDAEATSLALMVLSTSLPAFALAKPLAAVFLAREQVAQPLVATLAGLAVTTMAAGLLQPAHSHAGVAAAISLGGWITAIWLGAALWMRNELALKARDWRTLLLIALACIVMAAAEFAVARAVPDLATGEGVRRAFALGTLIAFGILIYSLCLRLFGVVKLRFVRSAF